MLFLLLFYAVNAILLQNQKEIVELNQTMLPEGELLPAQEEAILKRVDQIQQQEGLMLDELQRKAVLESVRNSILILTGGPGTGKTGSG